LSLRIAARVSLESTRFQHPERRAIAHSLPALKEEAQLDLRERIDPPFLQRQRLFERALGASLPFPSLMTLAPRAIHGGEKSRSGDLRSKNSEVEEVGTSKI
jgi:hypothetical protein